MRTDRQLSGDPLRSWFTLKELLDSVLADIIQTDARFQLMQGEAWRQFGQSLSGFQKRPRLEKLDFSAGYSRLENLAIGSLDLSFDIERYQPGWLKRIWWWLLHVVFRRPLPLRPARFRLARSDKLRGNRMQLTVKVCRTEDGRWEVDTQPSDVELEAA